jgi:hypothetical protein
MCLSYIFRCICVKVLDPAHMHILQENVAITMCMLEMTMPPTFFEMMTHLIIHLVEDLDICGPIHTKWMYSIE